MKRQSSASQEPAQPAAIRLRRLSILRHAKTEEGTGDDAARALTPRGLADAKALSTHLKKQDWLPEYILCSTARRARETLQALDVTIATELSMRAYLASPGELLSLIQGIDNAVQHLLLIGHNPGLHSLVVSLAETYKDEAAEDLLALKFPTSAFASLEIPAARWNDIAFGRGTLDRFVVGGKTESTI